MRYLFAIFIPPLAVLMCGRIFMAMIFAVLWVISIAGLFLFGLGALLWIALAIAAVMMVNGHDADKRQKQLIAAVGAGRR
jgi:hypothetical protein